MKLGGVALTYRLHAVSKVSSFISEAEGAKLVRLGIDYEECTHSKLDCTQIDLSSMGG